MSIDFDTDPISLEIAWGRLRAIADEAAAGLIRAAFSSIVRESKDLAVILLDPAGYSIVQSTQSLPAFIGTMPRTLRAMLDRRPASRWRPDDVVLTNDPWLGTGHLPDISIVVPVFFRERLVAFAGVVAHVADIGGRGYSSDAREVYEEGLRIPVCCYRKAGVVNRDLVDIIAGNVRLPEQVLGDIDAMVGAGDQVARRLVALMQELSLETIEPLGDRIQERSAYAMQQAIAAIPEGTYRDTLMVDGSGDDLRIAVAVTFRGGEIVADFSGSSAQVRTGINSTFSYSYSYTAYALKCLLSPSIPINGGAFRNIRMTAPEGSIVNCTHPAPVAGRSMVGQAIPTAIISAMSRVIPHRVIADCGVPRPVVTLSGQDRRGNPFILILPVHGGLGGTPSGDGLSCSAFPTNTAGTPIEVLEALAPVLVEQKEFIPDSGGAGEFRGGLGQRLEIRMLSDMPIQVSLLAQRFRFAPRGVFGGGPGRRLYANVAPNGVTLLECGERLVLDSPGGGGYGPPSRRSAEAFRRDLEDGVVSAPAQ